MRSELIHALELLHSGNPEDVQQAIELLQGTVFAFSLKVCGHREDAEDTMQEVLMRSLPHLAKIQDPRALAVWLYTVTRNRCWRSRRRPAHGPAGTLSLTELMPDEAEMQRLLQDKAPNPEEHALRGEKDLLLQRAVLSLPPQYRMVLVLHDMEELDTDQVATVLGLRPGTVRVRLHRARLGVRRAMAQLLEGKPPAPAAKREKAGARPGHAAEKGDCRKMFAGLSEYLDGRLDPMTCEHMGKHLEACPPCVAFIRQLTEAIERCRSFQPACDQQIPARLTTMLVEEYLRLTGQPA